ncbi:hypothetical protein ACE38V_11380 [Cytobacillus sp. Hz8]|uniref:hypothetical protein n=1 Tax=Cytobacillus sp. Hz8 TaxID=3347168 RepID=UPI0035D749D2
MKTPTTLNAEFSEELSAPGSVTIDGNVVSSGITIDGKNVEITGLSLAAGSHTVTFTGTKDINSLNLLDPNPTSATFVVGDDNVAPTVTSLSVLGENKVKVVFSEELNAAPSVKIGATTVTATKDSDDKTNKTYIATFTNAQVGYGTSKFVNTDVEVAAGYQDMQDNAGLKYTKSVTFNLDETKPVAQSITAKDGKLIVKFNEDVAAGTGNATVDYTTADGLRYSDTFTPTAGAYDADGDGVVDNEYIQIDLTGNTNMTDGTKLNNGTFKVTLPGGYVVDTATTPNGSSSGVLTYTETGSSSDSNVPDVTSVTPDRTGFTILFDEEVSSSALQVSNYTLSGAALPTGTDLYFDGAKNKVRVELPADSIATTGDRQLVIKPAVTDLAGNSVDTADRTQVVNVQDNTKASLTKVAVVDDKTLTLTFNELVSDGTIATTATDVQGDFEVYVNGAKVAVTSVDAADDNTVGATTMTVNLTNAFTLTDTVTVKVLDAASLAQDLASNTLKAISVSNK